MYQSLRYISNVLGYKIIDHNYPALLQITRELNKQTSQMVLLQYCASTAQQHAGQLFTDFSSLHDQFKSTQLSCTTFLRLTEAMDHLRTIVDAYYLPITPLYDNFTEATVQYP
jgi:hypothetical protein